jgi:hypothetical protein
MVTDGNGIKMETDVIVQKMGRDLEGGQDMNLILMEGVRVITGAKIQEGVNDKILFFKLGFAKENISR